MSRLVKKPISVPTGVAVTETAGVLRVKGPKGELRVVMEKGAKMKLQDAELWIDGVGTTWSLARNEGHIKNSGSPPGSFCRVNPETPPSSGIVT